MTDIILKHMELNEAYHQVKENMAWIGTSLYLAFSAAVVVWLRSCPFYGDDLALPALMLLTLYLGALSFVSFQFRHRWFSICKTNALNALLKESTAEGTAKDFAESYDRLLKAELAEGRNRRRPLLMLVLTLTFPASASVFLVLKVLGVRKDMVDSRYHNEIPTYATMTYLACAQLYVLLM